ncbi:MAG: C10 family peptidase [Prevotella sp.]
MKRFLLSFVVMLLGLHMIAGPVTKEEALSSARSFMSGRGVTMSTGKQAAYRAVRKSAKTTDNAYYYVFNVGEDKGFVVVSGDDRTERILGYTDSGTFDMNTAPENMKAWLQSYADYIKYLDDNNIVVEKGANAAPRKAQKAKHAVKPLVKSRWNQGDPYNLLCPRYYKDDGTQGDRSATGCVATAIAQVMYYYQWPLSTVGMIPSYSFTSGAGKSISMKSIAKGTKIDWNNMTDTYSGASTDAQKKAVAELMLYVGTGVKMGYGPSSGAGFSEGIKALVRYFGYDDGSHVEYRGNYSIDEWTDLLYNELVNNHPIAFAGTASGGAHAFVIDGYDGDGLFHLNWGWGGGSDGYFRVEILNPGDNSGIGSSSSSDGYSMGQEAIILRKPDNVPSDDNIMMTINNTKIQNNRINSDYINWSGSTNSFNFGIGYVAEDGTLVPIGNTSTANDLGTNYYLNGEYGISGLPAGTYKVVPISKTTKSNVWKTSFNIKRKYIIATVNANGTYTLQMYETATNMNVESITFTGDKVKGHEQKVDVVFKNMAEEEFYGEIYMFASKTSDKGSQASRSAVSLKPGHTQTITFFFKPSETGTYNIWLTYNGNGDNVLPGGQTTVNIASTASSETKNMQVTAFNYSNVSNNTLYGGIITGTLKVRNNASKTYDGTVRIGLWKGDIGVNAFYGNGSVTVPVTVAAGQEQTVSFAFEGQECDKQYGTNVSYGSGGELNGGGLAHVVQMRPGVVTYKSDGSKVAVAPNSSFNVTRDVVAVDMRGISQVSSVNTSLSPNALYFFDEGASLPAGVDANKAVIGHSAGEINLTDDAGFVSPVDFTADKITYVRTIKKAGKGSIWETLALPFAPTKIMVDGHRLALNSENGMYIRELSEVGDDGKLVFEDVTHMEANVPYIISAFDPVEGKTVSFETTNAEVAATTDSRSVAGTDSYSYYGTFHTLKSKQIYALNTTGSAFVYKRQTTQIKPYSGYFVTKLPDDMKVTTLYIDRVVTDITGIDNNAETTADVYAINGVKVGTAIINGDRIVLPALPKGIYIVNGRKIVK